MGETREGPGRSQTVLDKSGNGETPEVNSNYLLQTINDNRIAVGFEDSTGSGDQTVLSKFVIPQGAFHHIAGVYSSAAKQLRYI
ncbi:MAG: hypothetical protein HY645_00990 [Acidobacteria bacterium]|nr:hypothetical protein [Acidobacteriota bacterium]